MAELRRITSVNPRENDQRAFQLVPARLGQPPPHALTTALSSRMHSSLEQWHSCTCMQVLTQHAERFGFSTHFLDPVLFVHGYRYYEQEESWWPLRRESSWRWPPPQQQSQQPPLSASALSPVRALAHERFGRIVAVHHNWIGGDTDKWDRAYEWKALLRPEAGLASASTAASSAGGSSVDAANRSDWERFVNEMRKGILTTPRYVYRRWQERERLAREAKLGASNIKAGKQWVTEWRRLKEDAARLRREICDASKAAV